MSVMKQSITGSNRLEPINYTNINDLHPGRYGDQAAPWIQRKHFQAHNLSQSILLTAAQKRKVTVSCLYVSSSAVSQPPVVKNVYDADPQHMPQQASLRPQEQQLDKKWRTMDQKWEQEKFKSKITGQTIQDLGYLKYKQMQDQALLQRYKEYQARKKQETYLESDIQQHLRDQERFLQASTNTAPTQKLNPPTQQHIQPTIQPQAVQQARNEQQPRNEHQPVVIPQSKKHVDQSVQHDSIQQLISKQQQNKHHNNSIDSLNYRQRYRLNNNLYNPTFGVTSELFPENYIGRKQLPYNHKTQQQISYPDKYNGYYQYETQSQPQQQIEHLETQRVQPQQSEYYYEQPQPSHYGSQPPTQRAEDLYAQHASTQSEYVPPDLAPYNNDPVPPKVDTYVQAQLPEVYHPYTHSQPSLKYDDALDREQFFRAQKQDVAPPAGLRPFRLNPTSLSFKGVPIKYQ